MASSFRLVLNGTPADDSLYTLLDALEVEESVDLPGAIQFSLPVTRTDDGDLSFVNDARFRPFANLAVIATPDDGAPQCIFDGYVLSNKLHLETGTTASKLTVQGQDASWLMNLEEKQREFVDMTDADAAAAIFGDYGVTPHADNSKDDSPAHTEDGHSLMQRGTDIQFLRTLARRNGKLCRITCDATPGLRTGVFASPALDGDPVVTMKLNDPTGAWQVAALDIEWDVSRPSSVKAHQALLNDSSPEGVAADLDDSGLALLEARNLSAFAGKNVTMLLAAPVDDAQELTLRAQSVLRDGGWFVRCEGQTDAARLKAVLRAGTLVQLDTIGALHSGKYYVWNVRHTITKNSHAMHFVLVRNAVGAPPAGGLPGGFA